MSQREDYRIRPIEENDLEKVLEWRNSERIRINMYTDHLITMNEHKKWFDSLQKQEPISTIYLVFEFKNKPTGLVYYTNINKRNGKCDLGLYLGETNVPQGIGAVMEFLALEYIFEELKIRKLCCEVIEFNALAIKLHNRFGFTEEGKFIKHILKNNNYENVVMLALFKDQWVDIKNKFQKLLFR